MTGIKVSWNFSANVVLTKKCHLRRGNREFTDFTKMVSKYENKDLVWKIIKEEKIFTIMSKYFPGQSNNRRVKPEMLNKIMMDKIETGLRKLKLKKDSMTITEDNFESAWKMFVYLFSDMRSIWDQSLSLFKDAAVTWLPPTQGKCFLF